MKRLTIKSSYLLLLFLVVTPVHAAKLYKWVDAQGRVSYQDKPPPQSAKILSEKPLKKPDLSSAKKIRLRTKPIEVYVTQNCPSCESMADQLDELGVPYVEKNIEEHRDIQNTIIQQTNSISVPALFIDNKLVEGTSVSTIAQILQEKGYIAPDDPVVLETGLDTPTQ